MTHMTYDDVTFYVLEGTFGGLLMELKNVHVKKNLKKSILAILNLDHEVHTWRLKGSNLEFIDFRKFYGLTI